MVVSTHLINVSQIESLPQVGKEIKNLGNHHLDHVFRDPQPMKKVPTQATPAPRKEHPAAPPLSCLVALRDR